MQTLPSIFACQVTACGKQFHTIRALISHMYLQHSNDNRLGLTCGIDDCGYYFNAVSTFRSHVTKRHTECWEGKSTADENRVSNGNEMDTYDADVCANEHRNYSESASEEKLHLFLNDFAKHLAFLRLKMSEAYAIPLSVSSAIFNDMQTVVDFFQQQFADMVKGCLENHSVLWSKDVLLNQLLSADSLFERCKSNFASEHLFSKYLEKNLTLNSPVEIEITASVNEKPVVDVPVNFAVDAELPNHPAETETVDPSLSAVRSLHNADVNIEAPEGKSSSRFHYIPLLVTLKSYLEQPDVCASCQQNIPNHSGKLCNFTDGSIWQNSSRKNDKLFVRIHLYSDETDLCNPLSNKRNHKISAFYFLVGNIETKYWSSLSNIHLALLCPYSVVKNCGYESVLEPLLNDIRVLESEGIVIDVDSEKHHVFGSIVTFTGDNLTSHALGGFNTCFSAGRICRHCMSTKISIADILSEKHCTLRTAEGHLYHVNSVKHDKDLSSVYGVKGPSPFVDLAFYNPVLFFPPDIMHDVLEGLMVVNVGVVVKSLVRNNKDFTIKVLNEKIANFKFGIADRNDKFGPFPLDFVSKNKSVTGKAVEKWALFRLLPLLVGSFVPDNDPSWKLYLLSCEICDIIMAPVIDPAWLPYLELVISHHHALLRDIAPQAFIPKIHFVTHYPRLLQAYGPLRHLWAMRFEATHQYFKGLIRQTKNHVNVTGSMSHRFQRRKCYEIVSNVYMLSSTVIHSAQHLLKVKQLPPTLVRLLISQFNLTNSSQVLSVKSASVNGVKYTVGCLFVYDVVSTEEIPIFVSVKHLLNLRSAWYVCGTLYYVTRFNTHLHAFCVETDDDWVVFEASQVIDSQCLSLYNASCESLVIVRHRVCGKDSLH